MEDIPINYHLFEFTFLGNPNGDVNEKDYRYRIDLTKIRTVTTGKTRDGKSALFFIAENEAQAIQQQVENHDWTVGDLKYRKDEWVDTTTIFMPEDYELVQLFLEFIKLTQADGAKNGNKIILFGKIEFEDQIFKAFQHLRKLCGAPEPIKF